LCGHERRRQRHKTTSKTRHKCTLFRSLPAAVSARKATPT
jgi:hypothetical protein